MAQTIPQLFEVIRHIVNEIHKKKIANLFKNK